MEKIRLPIGRLEEPEYISDSVKLKSLPVRNFRVRLPLKELSTNEVASGIALLVFLVTIRITHACECQCVYSDVDPITEENYLYRKIRSSDMAAFKDRMNALLAMHGTADFFLKAVPSPTPPSLVFTPICKTDTKTILGYWRDDGDTLCLVVQPDLQVISKASCDGEICCGPNTKCAAGAYRDYFYLVYCDYFYAGGTPPISPLGPLGAFALGPGRRRRDAYDNPYDNNTRVKRWGSMEPYFAIRHDTFPVKCSCQRSSC